MKFARVTALWTRARGETSSAEFALAMVFLFAAPAAALTAGITYYWQIGYLDPWFYTGLIRNYDDIVDRIGPTYFAARIAHILPAAAAESHFGENGGFFAFRYAMLFAASAALFVWAARAYATLVGLFAAAIAAFSPWLLLGFSADQYEGSAAVYLLIAFALALAPTRRMILASGAAGAFLALSAQTVQLSLAVFAAAAPAILVFRRDERPRRIALAATAGLSALLIVYGALLMALPLVNPRWREGDPTAAMIAHFLGGGAAVFSEPIETLIARGYYYAAAPAFFGLLALAIAATRPAGSRRMLYVAALLVAPPLLFFIWRATAHHAVLSSAHTILLLFPPGAIAAVIVVGELARALDAQHRRLFLVSTTAAIAASWFVMTPAAALFLDRLNAATFFAGALSIALAVAVCLAQSRAAAAAALGGAATVFLLLAPYQADDFAALRTAKSGPSGWDIRAGQAHLIDWLSRVSPPSEGAVGFWYPWTDYPLRSVQSAYLAHYSLAFPDTSPGLPVLDAPTADAMARRPRLVLLADNAGRLDAGLAALRDASKGFRVLDRGGFRRDAWGYAFALVEAPPPYVLPARRDPRALDLFALAAPQMWRPASVSFENGRARLATHPSPGGFSAIIDIPPGAQIEGGARVTLAIEVRSGAIRAAAIGLQDARVMRSAWSADAGPGASRLVIEMADGALPASILIANASPAGASVADLISIRIDPIPPR